MKVIPLTQGQYALVDDEDYERIINMGGWHALFDKYTFYALRSVKRSGGGYTRLSMHTAIMQSKSVDHIDGNGLNNQRSNLRIATQSQQKMNAGLHRNNTSGYKGVSWHKKHRCWDAHIRVDGKLKHLGSFVDAQQAGKAYDEAAKVHYGEFALTNEMMRNAPRGVLKSGRPNFFTQFEL